MNKLFTIISLLVFCQTGFTQDLLTVCAKDALGNSIQQATLNISDATGWVENVSLSTGCGEYDISAVTNNPTLSVLKNINPANGLDVADLFLMRSIILGIDQPSVAQLLASDVNNSNTVSTLDLVFVSKLILGDITSLPIGSSWQFFEDNFDPMAVTNLGNIGMVNSSVVLNNATSIDFIGIKMGDLNFSADPNNLTSPQVEVRTEGLMLTLEERTFQAGDILTVNFASSNFQEMIGFQSSLEFDATKLKNLDEGLSSEAGFVQFGTNDESGMQTFIWVTESGSPVSFDVSETVMSMKFEAIANGTLSESIQFSSVKTKKSAYDTNLVPLDLDLIFTEETVSIAKLDNEVFQLKNMPNPFSSSTNLNYILPENGMVTLTIFDVAGKQMAVLLNEMQAAGNHQVILNADNIGLGKGTYFYQLKVGEKTLVKKMMKF